MKIKPKKIKAFSLQEMMVVLVITTVVVGMAFAVLNLVQRQMGSIETIYAIKTDINQLRQSLWIDFSRYDYIAVDQKSNKIMLSNELESRQYEIINGSSIRTENLEMEFESIEYYFDNQKVVQGEIDAISIITSKDTGHQEVFVFKQNTPVTYINQQ
ncbi:prepilin-type N-terminal cleavage/methylation domain-containing protein [Maribacter dokdonensis]|uniref:prepilin-type N-terminal cleavage/methylation domain-containing protein n=1 Tax=Maribacter dokdonensis TaxID=320912 RepID=UPI002AAF1828|nr:prepilin-type N-terminal cleavage/methylation domain-containing protein [Maribacter dokdonensis]